MPSLYAEYRIVMILCLLFNNRFELLTDFWERSIIYSLWNGGFFEILQRWVRMKKKDQCPRAKINEQFCNCTYPCDRHGLCCECLHYHRQRNELPACYFTAEEEKMYNRSVEFFVQRRSGK